MLNRLSGSVLLALTLVMSVAAQEKPAKDVAAAWQPDVGQRTLVQYQTNTRVDLTITDQRAGAPAIVKTVSLITSDGTWGRIRTQGEADLPNGQRVPVILNVDARPTIVRDNYAKVELLIEYRPADEVTVQDGKEIATPRRDPNSTTPNINESLTVMLDDGKPLVLSQSADPVGDRRVKVEAKLTIVR